MLIECFVADKDMDPPQIWLKLIPLTFEFMAPTLERDHQSSLCIEFVANTDILGDLLNNKLIHQMGVLLLCNMISGTF